MCVSITDPRSTFNVQNPYIAVNEKTHAPLSVNDPQAALRPSLTAYDTILVIYIQIYLYRYIYMHDTIYINIYVYVYIYIYIYMIFTYVILCFYILGTLAGKHN